MSRAVGKEQRCIISRSVIRYVFAKKKKNVQTSKSEIIPERQFPKKENKKNRKRERKNESKKIRKIEREKERKKERKTKFNLAL